MIIYELLDEVMVGQRGGVHTGVHYGQTGTRGGGVGPKGWEGLGRASGQMLACVGAVNVLPRMETC